MGLASHQQAVSNFGDPIHLNAWGVSRASPFENVRVQAVEGPLAKQAQGATFRSAGVNVIEMLEIDGVLETAEWMVTVATGRLGVAYHAEQ